MVYDQIQTKEISHTKNTLSGRHTRYQNSPEKLFSLDKVKLFSARASKRGSMEELVN